MTMEEDTRDNPLLRRPAVTTVVLISALLVPVAAVPYALTYRRMSRLAKQVDHLVVLNADLRSIVSKYHALRRDELARTTSLLDKSRNDISLLRRDISHTHTQLSSLQSATRAELQSLSEEEKNTRHRLDIFPRLGLSLADVAAFMHESELRRGVSSAAVHDHSIERLRALALELQISSKVC